MARLRLVYRCSDCGTAFPKWAGQCTACQAWNTLVEDVDDPEPAAVPIPAAASVARPIAEYGAEIGGPRPTGIAELDRVLGVGIVPGSVTLLGGEPGIGKSTLLLQLLAWWAGRTLYVSAEESAPQVRLRAERLGALQPDLWLLSETVLPHILRAIDEVEPTLVVIDSIQTVADPELGAAPGSISQVRGCAARLVHEAKTRGVPIVLVGHVTKDGGLAGPRTLEHVVDVVLGFEGERHHSLRLLRAVKNRFGPTDELGLFEMAEQGLVGVPDASRLFLADRRTGVAGSAVLPTLDGQRPMLVEVQALATSTSAGGSPRRSAQGIDPGRLALLLAVLERRARVVAAGLEIYASAAGGVRLAEPGADLAISLAVASAITNQPLPPDLVVFGEVGLAGEVRQVSHARRRLTEAGRLGFRRAIVPANSPNGIDGVQLLRVSTVTEALATAGLTAP
ncbi:MAG: DNA repair protein RadA [Acidimicrobiales bacterium]|nr:DNA repair protein RadA [Acidimicrobiales bacterium]MCB9392056.1 DNA repair protein RadA [Acidimicrobiaceae bacterium]